MHSPSIAASCHTFGPWYVSEAVNRGFNVRSARGAFLAWVGPGSNAREAANAQLIAASPQLLAYCKSLLSDVLSMNTAPNVGRQWDWHVTGRNLRSLIALAEGDPSFRNRPLVAATLS